MKNRKLQTANSRETANPKLQNRGDWLNIGARTALSAPGSHRQPGSCGQSCPRSYIGILQVVLILFLFGALNLCFAENLLLSNAVVHTITGETLAGGQVFIADGKISAVGTN